tara:strand:+ start:5234 stop:5791 length:558 start_codon:yes stop_codon:yes gene_type:complete
MLNMEQLKSGLLDAFTAGAEGDESDAAAEIAAAIVEYASSAEILMLPGPILIPAAPPLPSTGQGAMLAVATADTGKSLLEHSIKNQFAAQDPTMLILGLAIQMYVNTSFTVFSAQIGHTATGATLMVAPPVLAPVVAAGLSGQSAESCAGLMASIIHMSFKTSMFNGAGIAVDGGLGAVAAQLLI